MASIPKSFAPNRPPAAASGISYVVRNIPLNVTTCRSGGTVHFHIPGSLPSSYLDSKSSYIKVRLINQAGGSSNSNDVQLGPAGFAGTIDHIVTSQNGVVLGEISDFGKYFAIQQALVSDSDYNSGLGNALNGSLGHWQEGTDDGVIEGCTIKNPGHDDGNSRTFVLPLAHIPGLFGQSKNVPLKGQHIDLRITFGQVGYGVKWDQTGYTPSNNSLEYSDIELVGTIVQLSDSAESMLRKAGNWSCLTKGVGTYQNVVPNNASAHTLNLGMSYSQLLGTDFVMIENDEDRINDFADTKFTRNNLKRYYVNLDGVALENQKGVAADSPAEIAALNAISKGVLANMNNVPSNINFEQLEEDDSAAIIFSQSLEIFKGGKVGFGNYFDQLQCSGRSSLSSTSTLQMEFGADNTATKACNLTLFASFAQLITFDEQANQLRISQ